MQKRIVPTDIALRMTINSILLFLICLVSVSIAAQKPDSLKYWHNKERSLRYKPDSGDFVIINGSHRFNRALYGTNTAFRVEAGDLPEFALYMPGMGGNLRLGLSSDKGNKWLINAEKITARYRTGSMLYEVEDPILGKSKLLLTLLAMNDAEGFILKLEFKNVPDKVNLFWAFGGASGKKFSRDGDLNVDPESSFYLKPENCRTNSFVLKGNSFTLLYGGEKVPAETERYEIQNAKPTADSIQDKGKGNKKKLTGVVPPNAEIIIGDANELESPLKLLESKGSNAQVLVGKMKATSGEPFCIMIQNPEGKPEIAYKDWSILFDKAEEARAELAGRIKVETPDPYINTLGGTLAIAADAIWEYPTYLHGAIGWRIRLNGWRGPYTGDPLGWHDRSRAHFNAYAKSQVISPDSGPSFPDPEKNLARQQEKMGNALYTSGYICRNPDGKLSPHHYDMNLVFIDALLRHFKWTGDLSYVKEMWPVLKRHLAWEKRNFDSNNDGLYDAYCCIWASDALEYNGSGVTHSSAYNYMANKTAAYLAGLIGENPEPYRHEAEKILNAMNNNLWISSKGWFAEYKDLFGSQQLHPSAALWTVYHTIDSEVTDAFQSYQMTRYVDTKIPHIPVLAKGLLPDNYYMLSSTNWMPYDWSINNVVMAENLHTTLAFWKSGRGDDAFKLWKSTLLDAMYLGSSPGNFAQMSFYDAARGEAYRDFADEIGMTSRSLVEGLFGIMPDALKGVLTVHPGLPDAWNHASIKLPDVSFVFTRSGKKETYTITHAFTKPMELKFRVNSTYQNINSVMINGHPVSWTNYDKAIGLPQIEITAIATTVNKIEIEWTGEKIEIDKNVSTHTKNETLVASFGKAKVLEIFDPQKTLTGIEVENNGLKAFVSGENGNHTAFVKVSKGQFIWWIPLCIEIKNPVEIESSLEQQKNNLTFCLLNNTNSKINSHVIVNPGVNSYVTEMVLKPGVLSNPISIPQDRIIPGTNPVLIEYSNGNVVDESVINWDVDLPKSMKLETVDLTKTFNDKVTGIFTNKYLSPRSTSPTLAIPTQGIGNWCYPLVTANIDDSGIRNLAGEKNQIVSPEGIPFATPGNPGEKNIVFTSLWDNYPAQVTIPLSGKAFHAYFLMAGSTNPMQSQLKNGELVIEYTDGSKSRLDLCNPETWWPIEQDYMVDDYAFSINKPRPVRVHLKTGLITSNFNDYTTIKGFTSYAIDGGAATILDLPLDMSKELKNLKLETKATEVIVGLMSVTLAKLNEQNK